jgi:hypothetical protein
MQNVFVEVIIKLLHGLQVCYSVWKSRSSYLEIHHYQYEQSY